MNKYKKRNTNLFILLTTRKEIMRSFKEFLEEELISEDDDKKEEKKESKKDSEKESEKKDKDKKEEKKEKKEEEIVLDRNEGYGNVSWKSVFSKDAYIKHMDSLDEDDDEYEEKIKPMVYVASFGKNYRAKFESVIGNASAWVGTLNKMPSETKEKGLVLSTIMDILDDMSKGEPDNDLMYKDVDEIYFRLYYNDEAQLKIYKKMYDEVLVASFEKTSSHRTRLKEFTIILTKN